MKFLLQNCQEVSQHVEALCLLLMTLGIPKLPDYEFGGTGEVFLVGEPTQNPLCK